MSPAVAVVDPGPGPIGGRRIAAACSVVNDVEEMNAAARPNVFRPAG
jgi:hypothetical protein